MKIVCASSLTLGREIFSAMGDVVRGPERYRAAHPGLRTGFFHAPSTRPMGAGRDLFGRRKDGAEVPIEVGLNPVQTEEGAFVLAAIIDITGRKQIEAQRQAALEESEMLLREVHHRVKRR